MDNSATSTTHPRLHIIMNGIFGAGIGGGDVHCFELTRRALDAGYKITFFGGHALKQHLEKRFPELPIVLTDDGICEAANDRTLSGQINLLKDYARRYRGTLRQLDRIQEGDLVYAATDYWFDARPLSRCRARRKMMILGMDSPTFPEIIFRSRPDVPPSRLNSVYYWMSQSYSLRLFRRSSPKRLFYVHPDMKPRLNRLGYRDDELVYVSNGCNVEVADSVLEQKKEFDVAWLGRIHQQKGIEDLLATLRFLREKIPNFRAVLVGKVEAALKPRLVEMGIAGCIRFTGMVSEEEKFRLFKSSRVFLMPSHHESWGIVVAEALACGVPVVGYDVPAYRAVFGSLVRYVNRFELTEFQKQSAALVLEARTNNQILNPKAVEDFKSENSWTAAGKRFLVGVQSLERE